MKRKRVIIEDDGPSYKKKKVVVRRKKSIVPRYYVNPSSRYYSSGKAEKKFIDNGNAATTTALTGKYVNGGAATITLLNGCAQGTTANTRIGTEFVIKSILLRGVVYIETTAAGVGAVRTMVVVDAQPNATTMVITDLLSSDSITGVQNLANRKRFKVLYDNVQPIGQINCGTSEVVITKFYKKCGIKVECNQTSGGTIGDITKNAVYLVTYLYGANFAVGAVDKTYSRIRYVDN